MTKIEEIATVDGESYQMESTIGIPGLSTVAVVMDVRILQWCFRKFDRFISIDTEVAVNRWRGCVSTRIGSIGMTRTNVILLIAVVTILMQSVVKTSSYTSVTTGSDKMD